MPEPKPHRTIDIRVLKYTAPVLLTTLACIQLFLGLNFGLTPWKGGGFGMFSTVDSPEARTVRVYLETDDGELPTRVPSWLSSRRRYARSFPTDFRMQGLAEDLAAATWVYREEESSRKSEESSDKNGGAKTSDKPGIEDSDREEHHPEVKGLRTEEEIDDREVIAVNAVRVEIWRIQFDVETNEVTGERLNQVTKRVSAR